PLRSRVFSFANVKRWSSCFSMLAARNSLKAELQHVAGQTKKPCAPLTVARFGARKLEFLWDLALGIWSFVRQLGVWNLDVRSSFCVRSRQKHLSRGHVMRHEFAPKLPKRPCRHVRANVRHQLQIHVTVVHAHHPQTEDFVHVQ